MRSLTRSPGVPRSTRKAVRPKAPRAGSSVARTMSMSATGALVMNILLPAKIYVSPRFVARVWRLKMSEPASRSLAASAPIHSPLVSRGRYASFCSSVPNAASGFTQPQRCALSAKLNPLSRLPWPSASRADIVERGSSSAPPYREGAISPASPNCADARQPSRLNVRARSRASRSSFRDRSAHSRMRRCRSVCSDVSENSIVRSPFSSCQGVPLASGRNTP